jgi:hypothetical protein
VLSFDDREKHEMVAAPDNPIWLFRLVGHLDSKEACEAAGKSHDQAIRNLRWHSYMQPDELVTSNV